jgi:hypothetical protein
MDSSAKVNGFFSKSKGLAEFGIDNIIHRECIADR